VLVCGFDFGTTDAQVASHMSTAGTVTNIQAVDQGAMSVTYASPREAKMAMMLQKTVIAGNSRFIDVIPQDPSEFLTTYNIDPQKSMQFLSLDPAQQQAVMAKGSLASARDPNAVLTVRIKQATGNTGAGSEQVTATLFAGKSNSLGGKNAVLVRGFDYTTTDEQIAMHMGSVGNVVKVHQVSQGVACVKYTSAQEAQMAVATLQDSTIAGNSRYIEVAPMDPSDFLSGYSIEDSKVEKFMSLTIEQQHAVIAKGSLSSARNPTAVLTRRMNEVAGGGSFGPARGGGGRGGNRSNPYGGGGGGGNMGNLGALQNLIGGGNSNKLQLVLALAELLS